MVLTLPAPSLLKPVRRGREMIDLLAVEEPKSAKIRAVSYEAAISCSNACARLVRP